MEELNKLQKSTEGIDKETELEELKHFWTTQVGQQLLQYMRVNKIINVNKVITRWRGGTHLGHNPSSIMKEHTKIWFTGW